MPGARLSRPIFIVVTVIVVLAFILSTIFVPVLSSGQ
jgi:hypothetical protein